MEQETLIEQKIGARIRRRRVELGLTQEQVGRAIGVSYQQIQKFERGANRVSAARLMLIGERLRTDIHWLCGTSDTHPPADGQLQRDQPWGNRTPEIDRPGERAALEMVRHFAQIDHSGVRMALGGLVRAVVERRGSPRAV